MNAIAESVEADHSVFAIKFVINADHLPPEDGFGDAVIGRRRVKLQELRRFVQNFFQQVPRRWLLGVHLDPDDPGGIRDEQMLEFNLSTALAP